MAFPSTFKPPHPLPCKCSFTFNTCSHGFPISSPKRPSKPPPYPQVQSHITPHLETKPPVTAQERSKPTISERILDRISHGFSSFKSKDQGVERNPVENDRRVARMEEKHSGSGSGDPSRKSGNENLPKSRVLDGDDDDDDTVEKRTRRPKKYNLESAAAVVRLGLEMCSKQGDVMGAIGVYDLAKREGVKLEQYSYAVVLYLCSSAATGLVRAANNRTLNKLEEGHGLEEKGDLTEITDGSETLFQTLDGLISLINSDEERSSVRTTIQVDENVKKYALKRGFEIYEEMVSEGVPMNESTLTSLARLAMSTGDGDTAFRMVKETKGLGINPRLRSYGPALSVFCDTGNVEKAFEVVEHMLAHGVFPEEPELAALLRASVEARRSDKVYYLLHRLRTSVGKVSPSTANVIEKWFESKAASRVGRRKWDRIMIKKAIENGGGGWHGQGWLGRGKWTVVRSNVGKDGSCKFCGQKLATIDLDPSQTEQFAESVAELARQREKDSSFERFQQWLDYYGPFEAVLDGANIGLFSQRRFKPSKVNAIANGIRQMLPSKKWPLIVLHNKRVTGDAMDDELNKALIEKWKNADALYATPTGSNDDWYWLYAAIKCKCLLVTNDEMRDHLFQLLGNDFFPKWKERHQVRFNFSDMGPVYKLPPPCSVVIQECENGHWHIPIASEQDDSEEERTWLCVTRAQSSKARQEYINLAEDLGSFPCRGALSGSDSGTEAWMNRPVSEENSHVKCKQGPQEIFGVLKETLLSSLSVDQDSILTQIEAAEKHGGCVVDFQI